MVSIDGEPHLCRTDEIGELLLCTRPADASDAGVLESWYFGLKGISEKKFNAHPVDESNHRRAEPASYVRTGLVGYVNPVSDSRSQGQLVICILTSSCRDLVLEFWKGTGLLSPPLPQTLPFSLPMLQTLLLSSFFAPSLAISLAVLFWA